MPFVIKFASGSYHRLFTGDDSSVNHLLTTFEHATRYASAQEAQKVIDGWPTQFKSSRQPEVVEVARQCGSALQEVQDLIEEARTRNPGITLDAIGHVVDSAFKESAARFEAAVEAARKEERESCAKRLELTNAQLLLLAGEMSADELLTVQAVLRNRAATIRANPASEPL